MPRLLLASIVPPHNDGASRVIIYRHLVNSVPFKMHEDSNGDFATNPLIHSKLKLPRLFEKVDIDRENPRSADICELKANIEKNILDKIMKTNIKSQ